MRVALALLLALLFSGTAQAQRFIADSTAIEHPAESGERLSGVLGTSTKGLLIFPPDGPVNDYMRMTITDSLFPGDCGGVAFDLTTGLPTGLAMNRIGGDFTSHCFWDPNGISPGVGRWVAVGPKRAPTGVSDFTYVGTRSSRDLVVVWTFGTYASLGGDSLDSAQTFFPPVPATGPPNVPSGPADTVPQTVGPTNFPAGCSQAADQSVLQDCLPDSWDIDLHRCDTSPFDPCKSDSVCGGGSCIAVADQGNSCIVIEYPFFGPGTELAITHDITVIANAIDSATPGDITIVPPLLVAIDSAVSFDKCMNSSLIHPTTKFGLFLGHSIATEVFESQWAPGGNLLAGGDFGTNCDALTWSGGTLTHSPFTTPLNHTRSTAAIGSGCVATGVGLGDTFITEPFTTDPGETWIEGTVFGNTASSSQRYTFTIQDAALTGEQGTTVWSKKTLNGYSTIVGGVTSLGQCQGGCVLVYKTSGLLGNTAYRIKAEVTTSPVDSPHVMIDEIHVAHTPIERQKPELTRVFELGDKAPSILIMGDSFANANIAQGVRSGLERFIGICAEDGTHANCELFGRARIDVDIFTSRYARTGARIDQYLDFDGGSAAEDLKLDYCILLIGTNDELQADTDGATGFAANLNRLVDELRDDCSRIVMLFTLPLKSAPTAVGCSDDPSDNDCPALKANFGWDAVLNP